MGPDVPDRPEPGIAVDGGPECGADVGLAYEAPDNAVGTVDDGVGIGEY